MTDLMPHPAPPGDLELKLRGLERLRTAGVVSQPDYQRLREKLLAGAPPLPPVAPAAQPPRELYSAPSSSRPDPSPAFTLRPVEEPSSTPVPPLGMPPSARDVAALPSATPAPPPYGTQAPPSWSAPPRSGSRMGRIAAVAALGVLAAGSVAYLALGRKGSAVSPAPGVSKAASTASATGPAGTLRTYSTITDFVPDAKAFVAQHRGLDWMSDVKVTGLDDAAFTDKLLGGRPISNASGSGDDVTARDFKALHIIPQGVDLGSAATTATAAGVVGFYDNRTKELYVRGTQPTPYLRSVIVHELTHALQDQWFELSKLFAKNDVGGESVTAFLAVVEGDALRMQKAYVNSLSAEERQQTQADSGGTPEQQKQLDSVPPALLMLSSFPYGAGLQFDQALIDARGQSSLDAAFRTPPTTTAEILQPKRYLENVQPLDVAFPSAAGPVFDKGVLGALGLALMFDSLVPAGKMTASEPVLLAGTWGGDLYVAYSSGSRSCLRDTVLAISQPAQVTLDGALKRWIDATPGVTLSSGRLDGSGPVTFTACTA